MTKEEAIKILDINARMSHSDEYIIATNIAIEALRQSEIVKCGKCKYTRVKGGKTKKPFGCYFYGTEKVTLHSWNDFCSYGDGKDETE